MVPFLGKTLAETIDGNEIQITYKARKFKLNYVEQQYPLNQDSVITILSSGDKMPALELLNVVHYLPGV